MNGRGLDPRGQHIKSHHGTIKTLDNETLACRCIDQAAGAMHDDIDNGRGVVRVDEHDAGLTAGDSAAADEPEIGAGTCAGRTGHSSTLAARIASPLISDESGG